MGMINFGIIGSSCRECSRAEDLNDRIYTKQALNEIMNEALELVCRQHEGGVICDCEAVQAKKILEFLGNQCVFCDNTEALIFNEVLPYIKKENPLKEQENNIKKVASSGFRQKVTYLMPAKIGD